jgi:DNA-binding NarL/FixJ family response regulator/signal transduction histidine kinase
MQSQAEVTFVASPADAAEPIADRNRPAQVVAQLATQLAQLAREQPDERTLARWIAEQLAPLFARERTAIARDLQEALLPSLARLHRAIADEFLVATAEGRSMPPERVRAIYTLANRALEEAHAAIWHLGAECSAPDPLAVAIAREVERVADDANLSSRFVATGAERPLPPETGAGVLQLARAALTTLAHYAGTHRLRADLAYGREALDLTIAADGQSDEEAMALSAPLPGMDLRALHEQSRLLGGTLIVERSHAGRMRLRLTLPYEHAAAPYLPPPAAPPPEFLVSPTTISPFPQREGGQGVRSAARVLIVDDHALTRAGLRALLARFPDITVAGEAGDMLQALSEVRDLGANVVLLDVGMLGDDGLEAVRQFKATDPDSQIILLATDERDDDIFAGIRAGASGYLLKDIAPDDLAAAIRAALRGEALLQPAVAGKVVHRLSQLARGDGLHDALTPREAEVLRLLARGLRNKEIAHELHLAERTVSFHLANLYQKLGATSRTEALSRALARGLLKR